MPTRMFTLELRENSESTASASLASRGKARRARRAEIVGNLPRPEPGEIKIQIRSNHDSTDPPGGGAA